MTLRLTLGLIALFLFAASLFSVMGFRPPQSADEALPPLVSCQVVVVYDGDTFGCDFDGDGKVTHAGEKVRLLGIDAPEMHYSRKNTTGQDEPYAKAGTQLVEELVLHRRVYLEFDEERYDIYDRTLAYVYLDPKRQTMLNTLLLEKGLAKVFFIRKSRRYEAEFHQLEEAAQAKRLNLWSLDNQNGA